MFLGDQGALQGMSVTRSFPETRALVPTELDSGRRASSAIELARKENNARDSVSRANTIIENESMRSQHHVAYSYSDARQLLMALFQ